MDRGAFVGYSPWGCIELGMTEQLSTQIARIQLHIGFLEDALEWKFYGGAFPRPLLCLLMYHKMILAYNQCSKDMF